LGKLFGVAGLREEDHCIGKAMGFDMNTNQTRKLNGWIVALGRSFDKGRT